jgi:hypothetical protein
MTHYTFRLVEIASDQGTALYTVYTIRDCFRLAWLLFLDLSRLRLTCRDAADYSRDCFRIVRDYFRLAKRASD